MGSLVSLETQYEFLTQTLSALLAACSTEEERDQIMAQYVSSRRNYLSCLQKIFHENDPQVATLVAEMQKEQQQIEDAAKHLENVAKIINVVADAVGVGTALAAKAA